MNRFASDVEITVAKNCPVKKNGKTIGEVVGVHVVDGQLIADFNLGDLDILGMYSMMIGKTNEGEK